jgi:hypothetical protein
MTTHARKGAAVNRRLAVLFWLSLVGVLTVLGLVLAPLGWAAEAPYLLVLILGLALLVRRARALAAADSGRTCSCCTSTVFDPVEVR